MLVFVRSMVWNLTNNDLREIFEVFDIFPIDFYSNIIFLYFMNILQIALKNKVVVVTAQKIKTYNLTTLMS